MLKAFFCAVVFTAIVNISYAQDTLLCDHPDRDSIGAQSLPWFGNNDYLENFLDSIGYPPPNINQRIIGPDQVRYHVPIKFWVYRASNGTGGPTLAQLQDYIDNLNRFYNADNNTLIGFYMKCNVSYINSDDHLHVSDSEAQNLIQDNKEKGCINIHVTNWLSGTAIGVHYRARFFGIDGIFLARVTYTDDNLAATIAHEVGHYFELDHTHQYSDKNICKKEAISRTRTWALFPNLCLWGGTPVRVCETTGDFIRDTPADHDLSLNNSCTYVITGQTDPWGDDYDAPPAGASSPEPNNIMSYNRMRQCRDHFSRLQIAVMLYSIERGKSKSNRNGWKDIKGEYDEYEPDNDAQTARPIQVYEVQERNFHQQYNEIPFVFWTMCDPDWTFFVAPCGGNFEIMTSALGARTTTNTRLTLFDVNLTQLAQNDNISPSNLYSTIVHPLVAGQVYFIRVENLTPNSTGYYRLQVVRQGANPNTMQISGPDFLCSSDANYTIAPPAGASVSWSATPGGLASISPTTGNATTLTKLNNGDLTLTATISNFCGAATFNVVKNILLRDIQNSPTIVQGGGQSVCYDQFTDYYFVVTNPDVTVSYKWGYTRPDGSIVMISGASANWYSSPVMVFPAEGSFYVFAIATSLSCGDGQPGYFDVYVNPWWMQCDGFTYYNLKIAPNPVYDKLTVTIADEKPEVKALSKTEAVAIMLYDINSRELVRQWKFSNNQDKFNLDVSGIKKGQYVLQVRKGKYVQAKHLLIN